MRATDKVVDREETEFGIRTVAFDPDKGFLLNGKPYELKGTCNHQDMAGVGAALPDRLQYFRVEKLKEMGCNAIRTSHNAPTPELLEACDHLGMLVMDENRLLGSDAANLAQFQGQIRRDRNHPSVAIWSIANEEFTVQDTPAGKRVAETMQTLLRQLDPTRPITYAAPVGDDYEANINSVIEVRGWNYHVGRDMDNYHREHPAQPEVGTEQASTVSTRGIYTNDTARGYVSSYDIEQPALVEHGRKLVELLCRTSVAVGRVYLDGLRLSRRTDALWLAVHQFALWRPGHVRFPQGPLLLLSVLVDGPAGAASAAALELAGQGRPEHQRVVFQQLQGGGIVPEWQKSRPENDETQFAPGMDGEIRTGRALGPGLRRMMGN